MPISGIERSDQVSSAADLIGKTLGPSAADAFKNMAVAMEANATMALSRADSIRNVLNNLDNMTAGAVDALNRLNPSALTNEIVPRYETLKTELACAEVSIANAKQAGKIGAELSAAIKNLGNIASAADLLLTISNPTESASEVGKNALATAAGMLATAVGVAVLGTGAIGIGVAVGAGVAATWLTKQIWDNYIAPSLWPDGVNSELFWDRFFDFWIPYEAADQDPSVNSNWRIAITPQRRDPLAIDLDGDGIETIGIPASGTPILFDHDADGVKTGTGWLKGDDAWLVLDRNGNGVIDTGRELFGADTLITVTETNPLTNVSQTVVRSASTGFEALRTLDTGNGTVGSAGYGDGVFNASDAAFTQVKLWQDLNQDGVSQGTELFSLGSKGITSIGLTATGGATDLGNGNTVTGQATVTRSNGSTTQIDSLDLQASNLNLANNPFYRQFTNTIPLTEAAKALPEMGGSGWLREAISLGMRR